MDKIKKVPALRFPGFSGDWEVKRFGEFSDKISDGIHTTPIYDENGEYHFINGNNLINGKIKFFSETKKLNTDEYNKHKKILNENTILLSINGTIGSLAFYNNERIVLGKSACYIILNEKVNKYFIYNYLQTYKVKKEFYSELTGSTIMNLSLSTVKNTKILKPSNDEQEQIADFLSHVDKKIEQLTNKKQLLESYKKGVMQKIFSHELRFKDDNGEGYSYWEEKKLGDISNPKQWPTISAIDLLESGYPVYGANSFIGYYSEYNHAMETVTVTCRGATCGSVSLIPAKSYITGNSMCLDDIDSNIYSYKYIYYFSVYRGFIDIVSGSAQPQIVGSSIKKVKINLPCLEEQTKIVNFLTEIDNKINHVTKQLEGTKQFKKGLLQKMFV